MWSWTPPPSPLSPVPLTHPRHCRPQTQQRRPLRKGGKGAENQRVSIQRRRQQQRHLWARHRVPMASSLSRPRRRLSMAAIIIIIIATRVGTSERRHQPRPLNHLPPPILLFPPSLFPMKTRPNNSRRSQPSHSLPPRNQRLRPRTPLAA